MVSYSARAASKSVKTNPLRRSRPFATLRATAQMPSRSIT